MVEAVATIFDATPVEYWNFNIYFSTITRCVSRSNVSIELQSILPESKMIPPLTPMYVLLEAEAQRMGQASIGGGQAEFCCNPAPLSTLLPLKTLLHLVLYIDKRKFGSYFHNYTVTRGCL